MDDLLFTFIGHWSGALDFPPPLKVTDQGKVEQKVKTTKKRTKCDDSSTNKRFHLPISDALLATSIGLLLFAFLYNEPNKKT